MIYRCTMKRCPHRADPCELTFSEYETVALYRTPCPIGEEDSFELVNTDNEFFCLIVGSRTFNDYDLLKEKADKMLQNITSKRITIISGGANGTDTLAERYADEKGYGMIVMDAEWDKDGKKAGFMRNKRMHEYISSKEHRGVLAFWDGISKGTAHNFELAKKYNNQIRVVRF